MRARLGEMIGSTRFRVLAVVVGALFCLGAFAATQAAQAGAGVLKVRLGGDGAVTRIVIDLDAAATGKVVASGENRRMAINLTGAKANSTMQGGGQGVVRAWSLEPAGAGSRLRIDLSIVMSSTSRQRRAAQGCGPRPPRARRTVCA
jgi:hypothetical protein